MPHPGRACRALVAASVVLVLVGCQRVGSGSGGLDPVDPTSSPSARVDAPGATPSHLRVVGLGDSVTSGEHCRCDDYVTGFARLLSRADGVEVVATDDGESGSTSRDLATALTHDADMRSDVRRADVVVVTMGANDLGPALERWRSGSCDATCSGPEVAQMQNDLGRVLDSVDGLRRPRSLVLVTTYWNVFADGDVARGDERSGYLGWSDTVTRSANAAIARAAAAHRATLVDLYAPFKGDGSTDPTRLLASDGDHPDAAGTAVISRCVLKAYEAAR